MKNVTKLQTKFIKEYIKSLNGEVSARKAGYKSKDLKAVADELLSKDFVINAIKIELENQIYTLQPQKGYVIQKLLKIAEFSLEEEDILDKDGNYTGKRKLRDTSAGLKALESLSKYLGLLSKEDGAATCDAKIITIKNLDDNKI